MLAGAHFHALRLARHLLAVHEQLPRGVDGAGEAGVVEELQRTGHRAAGGEGPVPLAAEEGHRLLGIALQLAELAVAGAELPAGHAPPAEALGQHLGEQAGAALRSSAPAGEAGLAAELAHLAGRHAADESTFAHQDRPVQRQRETLLLVGNDLVPGVGLVWILAPADARRRDAPLDVVRPVDRQRLVPQAVATVDHRRPRGVHSHHHLGRPRDPRLHSVQLAQIAGVDQRQLVLDRPGENRGVISLLLDPRLKLDHPVVEKLLVAADGVQVITAHAVHDAVAARDDPGGVHLVQHLRIR